MGYDLTKCRCINCKSANLAQKGSKIICQNCKREYTISAEDIPVFLDSFNPNTYRKDQSFQWHIYQKDHDDFLADYVSYFYQVHEILPFANASIVEVGIGNLAMKSLLENKGYTHTGIDIDLNLHPDLCSSILDLPLIDNYADISICFQCLEHLDFGSLPKALSELKRVSKNIVIISVPNCFHYIEIDFTMLSKHLYFCKDFRLHTRKKNLKWGHHWEIGANNITLGKVSKVIQNIGLQIVKEYRMKFHKYHHIFVLQPTD
jgi:uncharacterized protein YbaR (Trm112 family)